MSERPPHAEPHQRLTPPMQPGPLHRPVRLSTWPHVIGIITVVFSALELLGGLSGLFSGAFISACLPLAAAAPFERAMQSMRVYTIINAILMLIAATLLLAAGIQLLRRRRSAVKLCTVWAVLKMALAVIGSIIGYQVNQVQFQTMSQQGGVAGVPPGLLATLGIIGMAAGMAFQMAFPVFLLVWLNRARIRAETASWT